MFQLDFCTILNSSLTMLHLLIHKDKCYYVEMLLDLSQCMFSKYQLFITLTNTKVILRVLQFWNM